MSQLNNLGGPTPRRSTRATSTKASSVAETAVTTDTNLGPRQRRGKTPLAKVKARKSNAYGAAGRSGKAEELNVPTSSFAQAFQHQRGDAFARDEDGAEEEDDDADELGVHTPAKSGALNGNFTQEPLSSPSKGQPRPPTRQSFLDSEDYTPSEDDLVASSVGNTTKSFGQNHEGGMQYSVPPPATRSPPETDIGFSSLSQQTGLRRSQYRNQESSQSPAPVPVRARTALMQPAAQLRSNNRASISQSIYQTISEEQVRLRRDGPLQSQSKRRPERRQATSSNPQAVDDWLGNVQQSKEEEAEWRWKKPLVVLIYTLLAFATVGMLSSWITVQAPILKEHEDVSMARAVSSKVSSTWYGVVKSLLPRNPNNPNGTFNDDTLDYIDRKYGPMQDTIERLKNDLPDFLLVQRRSDGREEISDDFWNALLSKINSQGSGSEWTDFLKQNRQKLDEIFHRPTESDIAKTTSEAVSRDEFINMLQHHYDDVSAQVDARVLKAVLGQSEQMKAMVISQFRLHALAQTNLVANYELNLGKANFFSEHLGARADPGLCSSTFLDDLNRQSKWSLWFRSAGFARHRKSPQDALRKWEELGDCWCVAPDPKRSGQAQMVVMVKQLMFPTQVTVEHLPMSMHPYGQIDNAPRDMEFWVESDRPATHRFSYTKDKCQDGLAGWTCLGAFKYNIHAGNHVQTFDLDAEISQPITRAMIRVISNWGADHTCLYRIRLHGSTNEKFEYTTTLNSPIA